jgi:hypothetical protein
MHNIFGRAFLQPQNEAGCKAVIARAIQTSRTVDDKRSKLDRSAEVLSHMIGPSERFSEFGLGRALRVLTDTGDARD